MQTSEVETTQSLLNPLNQKQNRHHYKDQLFNAV
jgi:hypothetical protein